VVDSLLVIRCALMSEGRAEGSASRVLEVKPGRGAVMQDADQAGQLAEKMVWLGKRSSVHNTAVLTRMDTPLGYTVGNGIEVEETLEVLAGAGPADVVELTVTLAKHMLAGAGIDEIGRAHV